MSSMLATLENLVSVRRVPMKTIVITALTSYILQMGAIFLGYPLYLIAIYTLLPWIPVIFMEGIWKVKHYNVIAVFTIIVLMQLGHVGEHFTQVTQLSFMNGTLACPPPLDAGANYERAIAAGLRPADEAPTGLSTQWVVKADKATGQPALDANGNEVVGPAACGVLGQLDLEIVHLIWELLGWLTTAWLLMKFPRNIWLWIALIVVSIHGIEHLFISYIFFFDTELVFNGVKQLWATTVEGKIVTAHPVGTEELLVNFYGAGGKNGIMGRGGLVQTLLGASPDLFLARPQLHFWYNNFVFFPLLIAYLVEVRRTRNIYLAQALPELTEEMQVSATRKLEPARYRAGETIVRQGDLPDKFYIITKGDVEVVRQDEGKPEVVITQLGTGQYFGEVELINGERRIATVRAIDDVEVLGLDHTTFGGLMDSSEASMSEMAKVAAERTAETATVTRPG
ncbi:cyclic nucleotide-binding domain-containing protein [Chloroflexi bacterium TSY]|nr:cyclic nucleotide-binding domain-containing protein [Chloroflexi bacterium TSY]